MPQQDENKAPPRKRALVTGASRGIGRATALRLAKDGFDVAITARTREPLDAVACELRQLGARSFVALCDVRSPDSIHAMVNDVVSAMGGVEVLVNNAGRPGGGVTREVEDEQWREVIETNLHSVFYATKAMLKISPMLQSIINIASTGGKQGVLHGAPYSASKHGVVGFTKSLGLELAGQGITVNAVCPGFVETGMAEKVRGNYARIWGVPVEDAKKRIEQRVPIGRYISPDEVADMVAYLASERARGITAQALNVCGGLGNY
ncbi:SDR family oxidoreductase [Corallococcus sp. BB11-1]|uniref:SDR family NAD(P)-dependent oxidoreductase n=1 Tax=Corallococcus sp. BB11-1 TaxID=2996783 RepID=UPI00226FB5F6|nr:SDR family NAD(P)-dependent oxidoreductase [Corallococcus sp. BB11-1]MCY1035378.1 SDR family oxidoreductase [Corallococcus sp. BB11-1]